MRIAVVVERAEEGYVAYPLGMRAVVIGQGRTSGEAVEQLESALRHHIARFGRDVLEEAIPADNVSVTEIEITAP